MSDLDDVRRKLTTFDADAEAEAFWDLLLTEAVERVDAAFAFVLLVGEDEEYFVYPEDLDDLDDSPTFHTAIEAVGFGGTAVASEAPESSDPTFSAALPIRIEGEVAGGLAVERYEGGTFTSEEVAALEALVAVFGPFLTKFFV